MKAILLIIAVAYSATSVAQNINGKAYYESKTTVDMDGFGGREMTPDMKKMIAERMKNMLEKTYILTFTNSESIYKEEEKLETGAGNPMRMMMGSFTPGDQYKNATTGQMLTEQEFFGKQFLLVDSIPKLEWKLEKESKQIGQYVAFKATAVKKIDENDLTMARPRNRGNEKKEEKNDSVAKDPMDTIEIPKEVIVTAWYTPQIPVSNGPGEYAGLPGLILELNAYRTTILCSKIVMNPKDSEKIEPPTKGTKVSKSEYHKIVKEKVEEMRENFRGSGNRVRSFGG